MKVLGSFIAVLAAAGLLASCGDSGSDELTLYSGQHEQTMALLTEDFTKRTGIEVKIRRNSESALANSILREGSASPADVFVTENAPALTAVQRKGLLAKIPPAVLAKTPARYNSSDRRLGRHRGAFDDARVRPREDQGLAAAGEADRARGSASGRARSPFRPAPRTSSRS